MGAGVRDAFLPPICVLCSCIHSFAYVNAAARTFGRIARGWLISLGWIAWKNITEIGRGGACVPARVALQGRICR